MWIISVVDKSILGINRRTERQHTINAGSLIKGIRLIRNPIDPQNQIVTLFLASVLAIRMSFTVEILFVLSS
ncbi:hypothetical protein C6497_09280 [Candidatus Poribacteria bacterium]|nr:MAG: hypothetical protein C6497_09280 [Candidatus Poribacteria bacterium]